MANQNLLSRGFDDDWGCEFFELVESDVLGKLKLCLVKVEDIERVAAAMGSRVIDNSWISKLPKVHARAYESSMRETIMQLVQLFDKVAEDDNPIGAEFGEVMVSMGSSKALEVIFNHKWLPIAEIWKPQVRQNEGFDFHTICPQQLINFGEAKFSASTNPHGKAIKQIREFITDDKHLRDGVHLCNLASEDAIGRLNADELGAIAAFSINSESVVDVLNNAARSAATQLNLAAIKSIYLVGVVR